LKRKEGGGENENRFLQKPEEIRTLEGGKGENQLIHGRRKISSKRKKGNMVRVDSRRRNVWPGGKVKSFKLKRKGGGTFGKKGGH